MLPSRLAAEGWSTASGSAGAACHVVPSKTYTVARLRPAASKPPITYSLPPAAAAPVSSTAAGSDASIRCGVAGVGFSGGEGEGTSVGMGEGTAADRVLHAAMTHTSAAATHNAFNAMS